jgi:hypothetical protein
MALLLGITCEMLGNIYKNTTNLRPYPALPAALCLVSDNSSFAVRGM